MPARTIVVGRKFNSPSGGRSYEYVLRADVPATRQAYFATINANYIPPIPERVAGDGGITAAELTAIKSGQVVERYQVGDWPGLTVAQVEAALVTDQAAFQTLVSGATPEWNPFINYGTSFDGAAWTQKTVA